MIKYHGEVHTPLMWKNNALTRVYVEQGAPANNDGRPDQPQGRMEPPTCGRENHAAGAPTADGHVKLTTAVSGKKPPQASLVGDSSPSPTAEPYHTWVRG